jgi:tRNA(Ile)-lysidine synthase
MTHAYIKTLNTGPSLHARHINHGIHSQAGLWQRHCAEVCTLLEIDMITEEIAVTRKPRQSLEALARGARYTAFSKHLQQGDCLLLAHHADDQMETFLLRLVRGSGARGLGAMYADRSMGEARLLRPLLHWRRSQLQEYARTHRLKWIDDDSNEDLAMDRNFLRHKIFPMLEERWQGYRNAWQRTITLMRESQALNDELAELDWSAGGAKPLGRERLREMEPSRCANLLRYRLHVLGIQPPNEARLREFIRQLRDASKEARPELHWRAGSMCLLRGSVEIEGSA